MRAGKIEELFPQQALRDAITGFTDKREVSDLVFAPNLLNHPERKTLLPIYLECIKKAPAQFQLVRKLLFAAQHRQENELVEKIHTIFNTTIEKTDPNEAFGKFPEANIPVALFGQVQDNVITSFEQKLERQTFSDPAIAKVCQLYARKVGTKFEFGNEFKVTLDGCPEMLLVPAPTPTTMEAFFEMVVNQLPSVLVTLCSPSEAAEVMPFWDHAQIVSEEVHYEKGSVRIVERKLVIHQHSVSHIHYENWPDEQQCPDLEGLEKLIAVEEKLFEKTGKPIVINCRAGIGRTAILALITAVRKRIRSELARDKKYNEIIVNIPELFYSMRLQKPTLGGNDMSLASIYNMAARYFQHQIASGDPS